jgi:hypothetical protein
MSIISFGISFYHYVPFFARYRFVHKLIRFIQAKEQHTFAPSLPISQRTTTITTVENNENDLLTDVNRRKAFVNWLQRDGVFLLHLLNSHSGEPLTIKCLEDLMHIWKNTYDDESKLAEQLLRNQFQFSK